MWYCDSLAKYISEHYDKKYFGAAQVSRVYIKYMTAHSAVSYSLVNKLSSTSPPSLGRVCDELVYTFWTKSISITNVIAALREGFN